MSARVFITTQTAYVGGGMEEWLWSLVPALEDGGFDCTVGLVKGASFHSPERYLRKYPFRNYREIDGSSGLVEQRHASLRAAFRKLNPEIIICFNLADALYASINWKIGSNADVRIVAVLHSQSSALVEDVAACALNLDLVACVSKRTCQLVRERCGENAPPVVHLPTGVPAAQVETDRGKTPLVLGYVGRLDPLEKRVLDLVELVHGLADEQELRFEIAGSGPAGEQLRTALTPEVNLHRVVFHGHMTRGDLYRDLYPRLHALLVFSEAEGGPIVAWEAMRCGVVPVVSDFEGRAEEGVIRHGENALVFPVGDIQRAVEAVRLLKHDWDSLSASCRELPEAYCEEGFGTRWSVALNRVLQQPVRIHQQGLSKFTSPGRLAAFPGVGRLRLWVRNIFGRPFLHADAGGEWPHSYHGKVQGL